MKKQILSILLAACMLLTMIPVTVMAEATEIMVDGISYQLNSTDLQSAIDSAGNGDTVRLGGNINLVNDGVTVSSDTEKSIILDLNGYTITYSGSDSAVKISDSASLTVQDSSTGGTTGKITSAANCRIIKNTGSGTLTFAGGIIEGTGSNTLAIANEGPGKLFITGGTVQTSNMYALLIGNNSGDVEISGGTVSTRNWGTINHQGANAILTISGNALIECKTSKEIIFIGNNINPSLTIDGGRILGLKGIYVISENCTVEVNGGYIQPTIYGDDITVTINGGFLGAGISSNKSSGSATGIVNGGYVKFNGFGSLYYKNEADVELKNYIFSLRDANNTGVYSTVVTGLTTDPSLDYEYGLNDVRTDDYGELHIWLPEGKTWASVTAGGQTFSGEITYVDKYYSATLRLPSLNPAASITTAAKGNASSTSVDFTLTSAPTGTWKVYESADATEVMAGVTATLSGTTLTLASSEDPIEIGDYYVTVTEPNKNESERLKLTVEFVAPSPAKAITAFNFNEVTPNVIGTINEVDKTISLAVPYGTNVTNLVPTIIHTGASVSPNSGVAQDFTSPVTYTVTAEDDTTQTYTVTVTVAPAPGGGSGGSGSSGGGSGGSTPTTPTPTPAPQPAITVTEVKSELFSNTEDIVAEADVETAFGQPVEVKITDDEESQNEVFQLVGADDEVYPFDISLYSKVSGEKVQPKEGHNVRITLPVPEKLLDVKDKVKVVYVRDGKLEILASQLIEKDGKWYITFEAVHFSPYALIVNKEPPVSWTNPFSDVKEGSWYYSAVQYVAQNGLMFGTGSDTFSPQLTTNRAMIATILYRLSGSTEIFQSTFKDVVPGAYYTQGVAWAQEKGIIAGYGNGMFGPEDTITREQMAAILWRYAGSPKADTAVLNDFNDAGDISDYARQAMVWVYEEGIIAGKGSRILDPRGLATRAEAAMILTNYLKAK